MPDMNQKSGAAELPAASALYKNIDVSEIAAQVKATGGRVVWLHAMNLGSSLLYLKFYDAPAASVSVGSTTPDLTFPVATAGRPNGAGFTISIPGGLVFRDGVTIAATTGIADDDVSGPGANTMIVNLGYL